jgi:hypothetical protein
MRTRGLGANRRTRILPSDAEAWVFEARLLTARV